MIFKQFFLNSSEYQRSLVLRAAILRQPLGLSLSEQDLENEDKQLHFGLFENDQIHAVVLLKPLSNSTLKLRQMAVSNAQQGKGLGKQLINRAEAIAIKLNYQTIEMAARASAVPFYRRLGFETLGEPFEEVGITHIKMAKSL